MGWFSRDSAAIERHSDAKEALAAHAGTEETDEFIRLNDEVAASERDVSWWRR